MTDSPEMQEDQKWEHEKAEVIGRLLHVHPEFIAVQAEQEDRIAEFDQAGQISEASIQNRLDSLTDADKDPETLGFRRRALALRKSLTLYESLVERSHLKRKAASEVIDASDQIMAVPEMLYDSNPDYYTEVTTSEFLVDVHTVSAASRRLIEVTKPLEECANLLHRIDRWEETQSYIDSANVDDIREQVTVAIKAVFGADSPYLDELKNEFDRIVAGRYTEYTPQRFVAAVRNATAGWRAKISEVAITQNRIIESILKPRPSDS